MASIFVGTLFFQSGRYGWSENYGFSTATPGQAATNLGVIFLQRIAMMVSDSIIIGGRLSDVDIKGDSYPLNLTFPAPGTFAVAPADETAQSENCARVLFNAGSQIRANRFVHGIPASQYTKTFFAPTSPWLALLTTWATGLLADVGALTKIRGATTAPFYTFTQYTGQTDMGGAFKKVGRPFDLPHGRRLIA